MGHTPWEWRDSGWTALVALATALAISGPIGTAAAANATTATTTPAPTSPTSVGSEYGVASFIFFLVIVVGGVWLWRQRAGRSD